MPMPKHAHVIVTACRKSDVRSTMTTPGNLPKTESKSPPKSPPVPTLASVLQKRLCRVLAETSPSNPGTVNSATPFRCVCLGRSGCASAISSAHRLSLIITLPAKMLPPKHPKRNMSGFPLSHSANDNACSVPRVYPVCVCVLPSAVVHLNAGMRLLKFTRRTSTPTSPAARRSCPKLLTRPAPFR
jgi:hypothetical protein